MARSDVQEIVDGDRTDKYGHPFESFTKIAAHWSTILGVDVTPEDVGHCMIAFKLVRDSYHPSQENRDDIEGYAYCLQKIAERRRAVANLASWAETAMPVDLDDLAEKVEPGDAEPTQSEQLTLAEYIEELLCSLISATSVGNLLERLDTIQNTRGDSAIAGVWLDFEPDDDDSAFDDHYGVHYEYEEDDPNSEVEEFIIIYDFDRKVM